MLDRLTPLGARLIAAAVTLAIAAGAIVASIHWYQKTRSQAAQGRMERGQAGAASASTKDAIATVAASGGREAASEDLSRRNEKDIRNATGANDAVNPASRNAGLRSLCLRDAYRHDPRCGVQQPDP